MKTHLDLFSGIGGFALAAKWAGFTTVGFCEYEDYPRRVLARHWPGVPIHGDIRELDGSVYHGVTLITGGFPCQPFSVAGQQAGKADDRYLWPEMLRIIAQAQPDWVVAENVTGIVTLALDQVLTDLEAEGYACGTVVLPACSVDAPHRRDRVWIVANSKRGGCGQDWQRGSVAGVPRGRQDNTVPPTESGTGIREDVADAGSGRCLQPEGRKMEQSRGTKTERASEDVADTSSDSTQGVESGTQPGRHQRPAGLHGGAGSGPSPDWWAVEPPVGRVAHGIPNRVDRLRGLGNAIVPQVAYQILSLLEDTPAI